MSDLVTRLRGWRNWREVHIVRTHMLLEEAAAEIERLRLLSGSGDCPERDNAANPDNTLAANATTSKGSEQSECTLTDEEREAVEWFAKNITSDRSRVGHYAATLRGLLERTK